MSEKYLIVGATGSIGSNLAEQMYSSGKEIHLVGRDESQLKNVAEKLNSSYNCGRCITRRVRGYN